MRNISTLILFLLTSYALLGQWNPVGVSISATSSDFGYDVDMSADGTLIIVGSPYQGSKGSAVIYANENNTWVQKGNKILGTMASDRLGYSVAMSKDGQTVAVGLPGVDNPTIQVGKAKIYHYQSGNWIQKGTDILSSGGYEFGWDIAIDDTGDHVAITSIADGGGDVVYSWNGTDWVQKGQLFADAVGFSPFSVALSGTGDIVAFGSPNKFGLIAELGNVNIYNWDGTQWKQMGSTLQADELYNDFGAAISISTDGKRVAIGIPGYTDLDYMGRGAVIVYDYDGSNWSQVGTNLLGLDKYDEFGSDLKLNDTGTTLVVGAPNNNNTAGSKAGLVQVFDWNGSEWLQRGNDLIGETFTEKFGQSVAIDADGQNIVVGSPQKKLVKAYGWSPISAVTRDFNLAVTYGPNPTTGSTQIQLNQMHNALSLEAFNIAGQLVFSQRYKNTSEINFTLQQKGQYLVKLKSNKKVIALLPILKL